jgi:hypothetical protein
VNDTHGENGEGWYGFDLDGTLAKYDGWKGIDHIGEPVKPMVDLIKRMHDEGKVVKIMTARVAPRENPEWRFNPYKDRPEYARGEGPVDAERGVLWAFYNRKEWGAMEFVADWCQHYLGFIPEIVYQKDHLMLELYDDRVKQVVPNEGWLIEDIAMSKRQVYVRREVEQLDIRWPGRVLCFLLGMLAACLVMFAVRVYVVATTTVPEAEQKLNDAVQGYIQSKLDERAEGLLR